ncbi:biotin operon repressor [Breznakia sp. PF5-3]|uniref:HTH domain-containing protein n=1 Tax=unclassified Breznakia TaxID=2623764 RepID=UPI0024054589|nr:MULTISPECIES: HTH domain-containing protein [unclassified Breznakia]MDF9824740.1 biotin operon repressor [Breznakia sp. PM6-1]MDF9835693.1 biotin operon repressor [Breznakia sp. PF5-3]MDF9837742.1 biotin operon repressor [Breznakia sp. PFB2-8]MDF9859703.1 biotin operon repressor [Breznakia sp. PH5-24]
MRQLLDSTTQRIVQIIEILSYDVERTTVNQLAQTIGCSTRAISKDVDIIRKKWGHLLTIETSKKYGIRLANRNYAINKIVFHQMINESLSVQWLLELFINPEQNINFYSEKLYVSNSTLKRLISKINNELIKYKIKIEVQRGKYFIAGDNEAYIRKFFTFAFIESHGFELPFSFDLSFSKKNVENIIQERFAVDSFNGVESLYYSMLLAISLVRENQGFPLDKKYQVNLNIKKSIYDGYKFSFPNLTPAGLERSFSLIIISYDFFETSQERESVTKELRNTAKAILKHSPIGHIGEVEDFVYFILYRIYLDCKIFPYPSYLFYSRMQWFAKKYQQTKPDKAKITYVHLEKLSKKVGLNLCVLFDVFIYYFNVYTSKYIHLPKMKMILVISDFSHQHATYLASKIENSINIGNVQKVDITKLRYEQVITSSRAFFQSFDIILSTIPLPANASGQKILLIDDFLETDTINQIIAAIE